MKYAKIELLKFIAAIQFSQSVDFAGRIYNFQIKNSLGNEHYMGVQI